MIFRSVALATAAAVCSFVAIANAEVQLPKVLSSHMVIQRNMPIHIWGAASPGEQVSIGFHGRSAKTVADPSGRWSVYLPPEVAGGPYTLTVQGTNTLTLDDILLGDVWIASGQSNMEMPLAGFKNAPIKDGENVIAAANHPQIRLLLVEKDSAEYPRDDAKAVQGWSACTPETARNFSAAAYFFGVDVEEHEKIPIGLVDTTWGGTPAEAWTSLRSLSADASLMPVFAGRASHMDREATERRYLKIAEETKVAGKPEPPARPWHPDPASWEPAGLYNAMIAPLTPMAIRGAIWYQGEANTEPGYAELYHRLFSTMIQDWRLQWKQGDFPFFFVQLSAYGAGPTSNWGLLRDAQRRTLSLANTGMAISIDAGEEHNIHPANKQVVGERLALLARNTVYGEKVPDSGPLFRLAYPKDGAMHVWFDHVEGGLRAHGPLTGFEVAGLDGSFQSATARIEGDTVVVSSPSVSDPRYVRYAWTNFPTASLYNQDGLPASTFTSFLVP